MITHHVTVNEEENIITQLRFNNNNNNKNHHHIPQNIKMSLCFQLFNMKLVIALHIITEFGIIHSETYTYDTLLLNLYSRKLSQRMFSADLLTLSGILFYLRKWSQYTSRSNSNLNTDRDAVATLNDCTDGTDCRSIRKTAHSVSVNNKIWKSEVPTTKKLACLPT